MTSSKIIFAGVAQNCAKHLVSVLKNIDSISKLFSEVGYVFIENDSTDDTKQILKDWGADKSSFHLICLDGLNAIPIRTIRLETARNAYIETIKYYKNLRDFDYLAVIDMDDACSHPIDITEVTRAINFLSASPARAAVFANQNGTYYDMWALRVAPQCPTDIWEDVLNYVIENECSDEVAFAETFNKRVFSIKDSVEPIKVDSAFGGLGIYKAEYILSNQNPYLGSKAKIIPLDNRELCYAKWQMCEHVHFHAGIKNQGGEMYIFPRLINGVNSGWYFPPSSFRDMIFN
ncbi:hypothetical protein G6694_03165 [Polynucleobacter paneuropaeus]|nr:hypothetical protein [Polynucleobacter paneuropaeus]